LFFNGWPGILAVIVSAAVCYPVLVVFLRTSGKRTLAKLNAFDLVVTVALGSTLATIILSRDVAILEGVAAMLVLILFQGVVAWLSTRAAWFRRLVKSEPRLLFAEGEVIEAALRAERLSFDELLAAARSSGHASLETVRYIVLETDGELSVVSSRQTARLAGVERQ